jgi:hypothetical protein
MTFAERANELEHQTVPMDHGSGLFWGAGSFPWFPSVGARPAYSRKTQQKVAKATKNQAGSDP